jgi:hypothetical protein
MYDPTDEALDQTFDSLLHFLRTMPEHASKGVLAALLEEEALLEVLLSEAGHALPEGDAREEALGRVWDRVEEGRDRRAYALLQNLVRQEG